MRAWRKERESACKPGSVLNSHSSRIVVTNDLKRPTRIQRGQRRWISIWPCSRWGLPCRDVLPRARCALTAPFHPCRQTMFAGGLLSAALSVGSRPPGVTWHSVLWSPDFPPSPATFRWRRRTAITWSTPIRNLICALSLTQGVSWRLASRIWL